MYKVERLLFTYMKWVEINAKIVPQFTLFPGSNSKVNVCLSAVKKKNV